MRAKEASSVLGKLFKSIKNTLLDSKQVRAGEQEQCAHYYMTCLLIACGLPPAPICDYSQVSIKRSFALALELNREFNAFLEHIKHSSDEV